MSDRTYEQLACSRCSARRFGICAGLPDADMYRLFDLADEVMLDHDASIVREEDPAANLFVLRQGHVTVSRLTEDGKRQVISFLFPGDVFGLTAEPVNRHSATTISKTLFCRFDRSSIDALTHDNPVLEKALRQLLTRQLDSAYELIFSLGRKSAVQKVASFIWYVSYHERKLGRSAQPLILPMSRGDIADFMGLTIETVSRSFTELKQIGVIRLVEANQIEIPDLNRLRDIGVVSAEPSVTVENDESSH